MLIAVTVLLLLVSTSAVEAQLNCTSLSDLSHSNCTAVTLLSDQELTEDVEVFSSRPITISAFSNGQIVVACLKGARFVFNNTASVFIENVVFVSCGNPKPGVEFFNVNILTLTNITLSNCSNVALKIESSQNVSLQHITIENNHLVTDDIMEHYSVVSVSECNRVQFNGITTFHNNRFDNFDNGAICNSNASFNYFVLFVNHSVVNISGLLNITNNFGPSEIIHFENVHIEGHDLIAHISDNNVCVNGALYLKSTNANFEGVFKFRSNFANEYFLSDYAKSVASVYFLKSSFNLKGSLLFQDNSGDVTAMLIQDKSMVNIIGNLELLNHKSGYSGILITSGSALTLNGTSRFLNNKVHNSVIRQESGRLLATGSMFFENNFGNSPCVFRVRSTAEMSGNITFRNNSGVLYLVDSSASFDGVSSFVYNNIRDFSIGGAIAMFRSKLFLSGEYLFEGNRVSDIDGGVVYGHLSTLVLTGNGSFTGNSARYGGAIYLQNKPQIQLTGETTLRFINNTAIKGGAFYVFGTLDSFRCVNITDSEVAPQCFINGSIHDHSLVFLNNTGKEGGSILQLKVIEDFDLAEQGGDILSSCDDCPLKLFTGDETKTNSLPLLSSDTFRLCFCKDSKPDCAHNHWDIQVIRGQEFSIPMTILKFDLLKANQSQTIRSYFEYHTITHFDGNLQYLEEGCNLLNFAIEATSDKEVIVISADESCEVSNAQLTMTVTFEDCPQGFSLSQGKCDCDTFIEQFLNFCNVTTKTITKHESHFNTWLMPYFSNETNVYFGMIYYEYCPVKYCSREALEVFPPNPDSQCNNNRAGIVCGKCKDGFSRTLGSSKCERCSNWYLFLLIPIAFLGIILVCFLFLTQLTVATGTIHGLILYANILSANENFFPEHFFVIYKISIAWLNLDFGIETCFYDGMDELAYIGWQFVFPVYLLLIVVCIVIICHWSVRVSKVFGNNDPVAVLATVILLSYKKLLQNVIEIFSVAHLNYPPNATNIENTVWSLDSNVMYGEGAHIILCCVAIVVIILLLLPYTLVLVLAQLLQRSALISSCLRRLRLTPFITVYQAPYRADTRFWIGLCLLLRCALLSTYAGVDSTTIELFATAFLCFVLVTIIAVFGGVYSKHWLNVLEISFIVNLGILSLITLLVYQQQKTKSVAFAYVSVSVAFVTFVGIVIIQIIRRVKKVSKDKKAKGEIRDRIKFSRSLESSTKKDKTEPRANTTRQDLVMLPDKSFWLNLREPLLEEPNTST